MRRALLEEEDVMRRGPYPRVATPAASGYVPGLETTTMMFLVTLELNARPADQYDDLERAIKALGNWSNRLKGAWFVESRFNASQIRDLLKPHVGQGDKIFVARMTRGWAGYAMGEGFPEWMNRRQFDAPSRA